jgi:hypothetical protein
MEDDPRYLNVPANVSSERRDSRDVVSAVETPHHVFIIPPRSLSQLRITYAQPASDPEWQVATLHSERLWTRASSALIFFQSVLCA